MPSAPDRPTCSWQGCSSAAQFAPELLCWPAATPAQQRTWQAAFSLFVDFPVCREHMSEKLSDFVNQESWPAVAHHFHAAGCHDPDHTSILINYHYVHPHQPDHAIN